MDESKTVPDLKVKSNGSSVTHLLPPERAVQMVWALTGSFSGNTDSKEAASYTSSTLKRIEDTSLQSTDALERAYVTGVISIIRGCLRSLEIIHKGRNTNFKENDKMMQSYLNQIEEGMQFGEKARDFLKALPTMAITTAAGTKVYMSQTGTDTHAWIIGAGFAALGYLIYVWIKAYNTQKKRRLYVKEDYTRKKYFYMYLDRVRITLNALYREVYDYHFTIFGKEYGEFKEKYVSEMLSGLNSELCPKVDTHIAKNKVTPERWHICEAGSVEERSKCPEWKNN